MDNPHLPLLRKRVAKAPTCSGIYRWKNEKGEVLYVGKAKNLRERLRNYVQAKVDLSVGPWKLALRKHLADIEWTVTNSDLEALILETNLIKTLKPKYNVMMKDDKNYVYLEVAVRDICPAIAVVRKMENNHARYFGPFLSGWEVRRSLELLQLLLGFQACKRGLDRCNKSATSNQQLATNLKPCLEYQIGKCNGLCIAAITPEEYRKRIDAVMDFFKGNRATVAATARDLMVKAAADKKFERAGKLRDALAFIEHQKEGQIVSDPHGSDLDVIAVALSNNRSVAVVLKVRGGKLIHEESHPLQGQPDSVAEALDAFLAQYTEAQTDLPPVIIIAEDIPDRLLLEAWCTSRSGKRLRIIIPERGKKSHLLELAVNNAQEKLRAQETAWEAAARNLEDALNELQTSLNLHAPPKRIEGYDISHLGGTETVGCMVVMENGKPANKEYRSFTLRTVKDGEIDDYKSLREVLRRRLRYLVDERGQWKAKGITIAKALKKDKEHIEKILPTIEEDAKTGFLCMVARDSDGAIIGCAKLTLCDAKTAMLSAMWIAEAYRKKRLEIAIIRALLHTRTTGKIYAAATTEMHDLLSEIGFLTIENAPKNIADACNPSGSAGIPMMIEAHKSTVDSSLTARPDLLVIDGGKGQLSAALDAMAIIDIDLPVIALAKKQEDVYVRGRKDPLILPQESPAKYLLMRLRDEAHRFSNAHREKRLKHRAFESAL